MAGGEKGHSKKYDPVTDSDGEGPNLGVRPQLRRMHHRSDSPQQVPTHATFKATCCFITYRVRNAYCGAIR